MAQAQPRLSIPALKVEQWLQEWDKVRWDPKENRRSPEKCFYLFSIRAVDLKALSGVYPRTTNRKAGKYDLGVQRRHSPDRSSEIQSFLKLGYPLSAQSDSARESGDFDDMRKPGWLPTAIVVNILRREDRRGPQAVEKSELVTVETDSVGSATVKLPKGFTGSGWRAKELPPIEIIDGQHRLWAFEGGKGLDDFQLPVVAFFGLDISWQAYLFYTINIKPKKINASLAFDLYPLLRTEDWLEKEGHVIYRETRAQELVDILWSHTSSPWHHRINMLGETGGRKMVSQAGWIRSLLAAIVKRSEGKHVSIGGLFGASVGSHKQTLAWSRGEQAGFLMYAGIAFRDAVHKEKTAWAESLRHRQQELPGLDEDDPAFYGPHSLIAQDQGIRAFLHLLNDFCFVSADHLELETWGGAGKGDGQGDAREAIEIEADEALVSLKKKGSWIGGYISRLARILATFDWRASDAPGLSGDARLRKAALRGSGGYKELRNQLLNHVEATGNAVDPDLVKVAREVKFRLGYS